MDSSLGGEANGKAYEKVTRYVQEQIIKGNIKQGQRLPPERELAEYLQVGRNSVREALRTLSLMGFITSTQGSGNYVSANFEKSMTETMRMLFLLDQVDFVEICELREAIEIQAVVLSVKSMTADELKRLKDILEDMRTGTNETYNAFLDQEFHLIIASASRNRLILQLLQALSETLERFILNMRRNILTQEDRKDEVFRIHEDIVIALEKRHRGMAVQAMRDHFELVRYAMQSDSSFK